MTDKTQPLSPHLEAAVGPWRRHRWPQEVTPELREPWRSPRLAWTGRNAMVPNTKVRQVRMKLENLRA